MPEHSFTLPKKIHIGGVKFGSVTFAYPKIKDLEIQSMDKIAKAYAQYEENERQRRFIAVSNPAGPSWLHHRFIDEYYVPKNWNTTGTTSHRRIKLNMDA